MCPEASTLSAFFDGELNGSKKDSVERHIQECPACKATLDLFSSQRNILRTDIPVIPENPDRLEHFWNYVGNSRLGRVHGPRRIAVPLPLAVAAAVVLAAATVLNFLPLGRNPMPDILVVETRPQAPTVVSLSISPGELDDFFAVLEGSKVSGDDSIHTLPAELPVARFGDPLIVRPASFEGEH
jgi:hypothetical protein